ncbi:TPA: hypothetical protein DEP58_02545 [Patescibacteria group bacterium]|nr:MAG: hypothetical protein UU98_C0030G0005 [Parcubacteria group bacterium GW2011_GWD2_42_14]HCC05162.1 hypothetical protein [Patescibacteria group bacterium]
MKTIQVIITEKDKGVKSLSLFNLRDELVNFLYRDTIALSTKSDLQFYLLLFFLSLKSGNQTLAESILDEAIPQFKKLNETLSHKKGYLKAGEYSKKVEEHGLTEVFKNDIFFLLIEAILNKDEIDNKYHIFFDNNHEIGTVFKSVCSKYYQELFEYLSIFSAYRIQDDREDEYGNTHDLSKSVYRMVRMRNARALNLNLQRYTEVKIITSQSPIDLTFLQYVDIQIIFDIWDRLQVVEYTKTAWRGANNSPIISGAVAGTVGGIVSGVVLKYFDWKKVDGRSNKIEKDKNNFAFQKAKNDSETALEPLTIRLVESVLDANKHLGEEIDRLKQLHRDQIQRQLAIQNKEEIKKLEKRIRELENLSISTELLKKDKE